MMSDNQNTADWQRIAAGVRIALEKRMNEIGAMNPGELRDYVNALLDAEKFEGICQIRDDYLEAEVRKLELHWNE